MEPSQSDPYRVPATEAREELPRQRLAAIADFFGLWRSQWVRRLLGGRWEKFLIVFFIADGTAVTVSSTHWELKEAPPIGRWVRVTRWSTDNACSCDMPEVGVIWFLEFLGTRRALATCHREHW